MKDNKYFKLDINPKNIYNNSILYAIAENVMFEFYNETYWDKNTCIINNNEGTNGAITFTSNYIVGAFFEHESYSSTLENSMSYYDGAPNEVKEIAQKESLQYLLMDTDDGTKPVITTAFWGTWEQLYSNQTPDEFNEKSGNVLKYKVLDYQMALNSLKEEMECSDDDIKLIEKLYNHRISKKMNEKIYISSDEVDKIHGNFTKERMQNFNDMNIYIQSYDINKINNKNVNNKRKMDKYQLFMLYFTLACILVSIIVLIIFFVFIN